MKYQQTVKYKLTLNGFNVKIVFVPDFTDKNNAEKPKYFWKPVNK